MVVKDLKDLKVFKVFRDFRVLSDCKYRFIFNFCKKFVPLRQYGGF